MWLRNNVILITLLLIILNVACRKSVYERATEEEKKILRARMLSRITYSSNDNEFAATEYFLQEGVPASSCDSNGFPAIHCAMVNHGPRTVMLLIEHGADINARDPDSATLLHYAAAAGYPSIVKCLIDSGADVNARAIHGLTPALFAAYVWFKTPADSLELIWKYLMDAGADPNAIDVQGYNALSRAVIGSIDCNNCFRTIPSIGDRGYEYGGITLYGGYTRVEGKNGTYNRSSNIRVLKPLIQHGASPDVKNNEGISAREYAEEQYKKECKEYKSWTHIKSQEDSLNCYSTYGAVLLFRGIDVKPLKEQVL